MAAALSLPADAGKGRTVAILGAGVSGLCSAYELDRAGYDCVILEPQRRAGGRSLTLRRGDTFREMGDSPLQTCEFDEGLWLNAGPGRIPHSHVNVIDYCRRFGVALQPYIFASRANLVHSSKLGNGRTIQVRQALYDLQGLVAELADKCIAKGGLDLPVTGVELDRLHEMLAQFGDLTKTVSPGNAPSYSYQNKSGHAGYEILPGSAYQPGKPLSPLKLEEILRSNVWNDWIFRDADYFWQTSLMEPVGGMDMFAKSFLRQPLTRQSGTVDGLIRYGARVTAIENASDKVTVQYQDGNSARTLEADYCISTIPMPVFVTLKTNLPNDVMTAAANLPAMAAGKVGWQAERFWEINDNIYGGISWTDEAIDQIWYPSSGYLSAKGTLTGAYMRGKRRRSSTPIRSPNGCAWRRSRASDCIPALSPSPSSMGSPSAGTTWSSRGWDGLTKATRNSAQTHRCSASRRAAFTLPAIRSRSGPVGRKARFLPPIWRSSRSTSRTIRRLGAVEAAHRRNPGSVICD